VVIDDTGTLDVLGPVPGSGGAVFLLVGEIEGAALKLVVTTDSSWLASGEPLVAQVGEARGAPQRPGGQRQVRCRLGERDTAEDPAADSAHGSAVIRFLPVDAGA
jgi:hypothetical protein